MTQLDCKDSDVFFHQLDVVWTVHNGLGLLVGNGENLGFVVDIQVLVEVKHEQVQHGRLSALLALELQVEVVDVPEAFSDDLLQLLIK